ncbi:hypothetical protein LINGRAPRIM_LOCUS383 [Linum grandiflorum]
MPWCRKFNLTTLRKIEQGLRLHKLFTLLLIWPMMFLGHSMRSKQNLAVLNMFSKFSSLLKQINNFSPFKFSLLLNELKRFSKFSSLLKQISNFSPFKFSLLLNKLKRFNKFNSLLKQIKKFSPFKFSPLLNELKRFGSALAAQLTASKLFFQWVLMRLNLKGLKLLICFNKELNLLNLFNSFNRRLNLKGLKLLICFNRELNLLNLSSTARFRFSLFTGGFVVVLKPADGILGVGLPTVNADGVMVYSVNN